MKAFIKYILVLFGLRHPAKGVKVSKERKAEILLFYKGDKEVFVETGTETGWMIDQMQPHFRKLHTIERDYKLYSKAQNKHYLNVNYHNGDSAKILPLILHNEPTLFWLDAHGPGEITLENSPIKAELNAVLTHRKDHTILIDDARHFPLREIRRIKEMVKKYNYHFELKEGIIRLS